MPNESRSQTAAREMSANKARTREAAQRWRRWVAEGAYAGLPAHLADDLWRVAEILDTAEIQLGQLPDQHRRSILGFVGALLDDSRHKPSEVAALTDPRGEGK